MKGYLILQNLSGTQRDQKNKNSYVNCLIPYIFKDLKHDKKDKVQVPQQNEMPSLYCTALGFISEKE